MLGQFVVRGSALCVKREEGEWTAFLVDFSLTLLYCGIDVFLVAEFLGQHHLLQNWLQLFFLLNTISFG